MSILTLPVYDLHNNVQLPSPSCDVEYRNTLLGHLYPDTKFMIGDASDYLADFNADEVAHVLDQGWADYRIVGASGSRKSGRCIYAPKGGDYFTRWFGGSNAHAINYGSNLTTECRTIERIKVKVLVVNDGEWNTGDCHAKCSAKFAHRFAGGLDRAIQFRAAFLDKSWIAKGTVAYSPEVISAANYDLVIPTSSFKGNKVKPGKYTTEILFGVVHLSEQRSVNLSYSVVQFLPWPAVEVDLLPPTVAALQHLNSLMTSPLMLAEHLIKTSSDADCDDDEDGNEQQYIPALAKIVAADEFGQVAYHPWTVERIAKLFRRRWIKLATASAVKFNSSMTMPDEALADDEVCIPGLADGEEVIVFPYPCRWKHDLRVWKNRALPQWQEFKGVFVANAATLLKLGRDTDGDFIQHELATVLPNLAQAIKDFGACPADGIQIKPNKQALTGSLGDIAVLSMGNQTGLITWLVAKAWATGNAHYIFNAKQPTRGLLYQLQSAVDMLKGAAPPDQALLDFISESMKHCEVSWLKEYKDSNVGYKQYFTATKRDDTISQLVRAVGEYWQPFNLRAGNIRSFQGLFDKPSDKRYVEKARIRSEQYTKAVSAALAPAAQYRAKNKPVPKHIEANVSASLKNLRTEYENLLANCDEAQALQAMSAFWHLSHQSNGNAETSSDRSRVGQSGLPFLIGIDLICSRLGELRLNWLDVVGRDKSDLPEQVWNGELLHVSIVPEPGQKYPLVLDWEGRRIGFLSKASSPDLGFGDYVISLKTQFNRNQSVGNWSKATVLEKLESVDF